MSPAKSTLTDEVIDATDVVVSPRGRKKEIDPKLVEALSRLEPGKAIRLGGMFGAVAKDKRQAVSATIRKHFTHVNGEGEGSPKCKVDYSPEGIPQVRIKATA